jgi:hypothetical protein
LSFSFAHRPSVASPENGVREKCITIADNFLNEYSGVQNITQGNSRREDIDIVNERPQKCGAAEECDGATFSFVIARLDRATQYFRDGSD